MIRDATVADDRSLDPRRHVDPRRRAVPDGASDPLIVVLTGTFTASSGEMPLIASAGHPSTRTFGEATTGVPTRNTEITLRDGAALLLTTALTEDRRGRLHDGPISPDQRVDID